MKPIVPASDRGLTRALVRLTTLALVATFLAPLVTILCSNFIYQLPLGLLFQITLLWVVVLGLLTALYLRARGKIDDAIDSTSVEAAQFLDRLGDKYLDGAIFVSAALSLFLELSVIRWQSSMFEFFAFYKNFSLLACFAGLGLGYALAKAQRIGLVLTIPLLGCQMLLMLVLRHGMGDLNKSLLFNVFLEQISMGVFAAGSLAFFAATYFFLAVVFTLTALAFIPVGQLCGRLMERRTSLRAYGINLLGSAAGVALTCAVSFLWTPPVVWFAVAFGAILIFAGYSRGSLLFGVLAALVCLVILAWPTSSIWHRVYSPYQLLEQGPGDRGTMELRAAGHYYQRVHDLSRQNANLRRDPELMRFATYYELPYKFGPKPLARVAVVGAGTGNDVAAALRSGAQRVDAVEIDPAIVEFGRGYHPEHPYSSDKVEVIVNDARTHLRATRRSYDMIVYGLLDSHTLLSHASSVRIDSFVYTVEAFKEARARLAPDGVLSLSFTILSPGIARKMYLMIEQAFDGHPPVVIFAGYDGSAIFLQSKEGDLRIPKALLAGSDFKNVTSDYAQSRIKADVSTDDWPFLYMPTRVYPKSYLAFIGLIAALQVALVWNFAPQRPNFGHASFFFLGAGFTLVETKGITELGLLFGNTWLVVGVVIAAILVMAFFANLLARFMRPGYVAPAYGLLLLSLLAGFFIVRSGGLSAGGLGPIAATALLTCPLFFSGLIFSTCLRETGNVSRVMAANLVGAMAGGLLEYNSMYFGFGALYLMAAILYALALVSWLVARSKSRG